MSKPIAVLFLALAIPGGLAAQSISAFILVDASTNSDLFVLTEATVVNRSATGNRLSIRVSVGGGTANGIEKQ